MRTIDSVSKQEIEEFETSIRGTVILKDHPNYDQSRKIYNAMIQKHPGMIVMCTDVADVQKTLLFGRKHELIIAVRGGGHNGGGFGICEGGLVIDLSGLKSVRVDVEEKTVRVGGGNIWAEVDHATHPYGLAVPAGIVSTTGVGGLSLGGGVGHLARNYGLTIDNLLEADMVLADGSLVTVNKDKNPDLFWAIRGGGGNFGIVTSFKFQGHELTNVVGGPTLWPIERTEEVMAWYHEFIQNAPETLNGFFTTMIIPGAPFPEHLHMKKFCGIVWCYSGDLSKATEIFEPILAKKPLFEHVSEMPYPAIQGMFDGLFPAGLQWYWRADFFNELTEEMGKEHLKYGSTIPTALSQMHLYPITGAAARVGSSDTPWAYRDASYAGVIVGVDPDPKNADKITDWCKSYWDALHGHSSGGAYSNFMMDEGQDRVKASFRHNYDRLVEIKSKYDPQNIFRLNQNIVPVNVKQNTLNK